MKVRGWLALLSAIVFSSCEPHVVSMQDETQSGTGKIPDNLPFPVLASRNWSAQVVTADGKRLLLVTGEVDLPTPGYKVSWKHGPMDRMAPPGVRIPLTLTKPSGMVVQVVTPTEIKIEVEAQVPLYREVIVSFEKNPIATIPLTDIK